jgi:hypothetical protein
MTMDAQQVLVLTRWGARWMKHAWNILVEGNSREQLAKSLISKLDEEKCDPEAYVDAHTYTTTHTVYNKITGEELVGRVAREKKVLRKGRRSNFSCTIAQLAYNKFGQRSMSEANVLVTRRWIQKLLEEPQYKDLRVCDKNIAIDRALFLSFVPTDAFREMKMVVQTKTWADRLDANSVFGKVFSLVSAATASSEAGNSRALL